MAQPSSNSRSSHLKPLSAGIAVIFYYSSLVSDLLMNHFTLFFLVTKKSCPENSLLPLRACLPTTTPVRESRTVFCMATRMHGAGGLAHWVRASFRRPEFTSQHPSLLTATRNSSSKGSHALCWLLWAPSHAHAHKIDLEKQCSIINRGRG